MVSISLPDAAGAKLRYNGAEHAVDAQGRAEFPVTLPADRVGYIDVPVEVVRGASVEPRSMRFLVAWRAQTDLAKLGDDPPKIHIVFHVMRGSSLWIAGQQIRVSGETGIAELAGPAPSPAGEGDARRERYPVRVVTPDGTSIEEQYELRVPRTQLRVDDPPRVLMTREASIAVHGSAPTASRVRIGGQAATLSAGQFSAVVPVTAGSNSLDVVAYAPDGAPALVNLTVYRDVTPEAYLSSGGGDRSVAAIATRPPPEGARLRVTGTVVGNVIDAPTGRTCQIVVENRACPGGRCTAWVDLPPSVQVTPNAVVEVVGEIRGSRAYATQSGERRSDPVVLAVIVTPRRSGSRARQRPSRSRWRSRLRPSRRRSDRGARSASTSRGAPRRSRSRARRGGRCIASSSPRPARSPPCSCPMERSRSPSTRLPRCLSSRTAAMCSRRCDCPRA